VVGLVVVIAICVCAAPVLGVMFLNATFFHGFSAVCADGYPRTATEAVGCAPDWRAGLPCLALSLTVTAAAISAFRQLVRPRRTAASA